MSYTNMDIRDNHHDRRAARLLEAELAFWRNTADELQAKLENIPRAIKEYGHVDLYDGSERITLIQKSDDEARQ